MGLIGIDKLVTMFILGKIAWKRMKEGKTQYFCDAVDTLMIPYKIDINNYNSPSEYLLARNYSLILYKEWKVEEEISSRKKGHKQPGRQRN